MITTDVVEVVCCGVGEAEVRVVDKIVLFVVVTVAVVVGATALVRVVFKELETVVSLSRICSVVPVV